MKTMRYVIFAIFALFLVGCESTETETDTAECVVFETIRQEYRYFGHNSEDRRALQDLYVESLATCTESMGGQNQDVPEAVSRNPSRRL